MAGLLSLLACGCIGVGYLPGYISHPPREKGSVDLGVVGHGESIRWGGGTFHVEPYLTGTLSMPIAVSGGGGDLNWRKYGGGGAARLGLRYRPASWVSVGGGIGGSVHGRGGHVNGGLVLDTEAAFGGVSGRAGGSVGFRPSYDVLGKILFFPLEVSVALYVAKRMAITLHGYLGGVVFFEAMIMEPPMWPWGGGGLGVAFNI